MQVSFALWVTSDVEAILKMVRSDTATSCTLNAPRQTSAKWPVFPHRLHVEVLAEQICVVG